MLDEAVNIQAAKSGIADISKKRSRQKPAFVEIIEQARIIDSLQGTRSDLAKQRQEVFTQARTSSIVAVSLLSVGTLLVFAGIICAYTINLNAGVITIAASAVIDVIGAIVFRYNNQTNSRLDAAARELTTIEKATTAMYLIGYISDAEKRDQAIVELVQQLSAMRQTK